jgi:hypothetical protein
MNQILKEWMHKDEDCIPGLRKGRNIGNEAMSVQIIFVFMPFRYL